MSTKKSADTSFRDLVARLNAMSNMTPEEERASLMEAAGKAPKVLDDKDISLADIAKLAGIKEYVKPATVSEKAEKLVESIVAEPKAESVITKAIKESDADTSIATTIKEEVNEEVKRLDKIAELEAQLAELKAEEKADATMDDKAFREVFTKEIIEYVKEAEAQDLVELYNRFSANEVDMNEDSFVIRTPETTEIIADVEKSEAPEEEVIAEKEPEEVEHTHDDGTTHKHEGGDKEHTHDDKEEDIGEEVEIEAPAEDKFTNDLDPADKK